MSPKHHDMAVNAANAAASAGAVTIGAKSDFDWLFWGGLVVLCLQGIYWVLRIIREHKALKRGELPTGPGKL